MSTPIEELVLVDASAVIGMMQPASADHSACAAVGNALPVGKSLICWPVVTEAVHILGKRPHHVGQFLASLRRGWLSLLQLTVDDIEGIRRVMDNYDDQEVDLADAAIVHLANRENIRTVFTLDRRHFRLFTREDGTLFRLLPDDFTA